METFCGSLLFAAVFIVAVAVFRAFFAAVTTTDPLAEKVQITPIQRPVAFRRLITIWRLLYETRWVVGSVMTIPVIYCFICLHKVQPEDAVRITGLSLQVFGLLLVFYQLVKLRQRFKKQSYLSLLIDWLQRLGRAFNLGKPRSHTVSLTDGLSFSVSLVGGELKHVLKLNESQSLQEQVSHLAKVLKNHDDIYGQRFKELREEINTIKGNVNSLADSERMSREELAKVVETVSVGDHALELLGVFWLIVGVVLSTIPDSIYRLLP